MIHIIKLTVAILASGGVIFSQPDSAWAKDEEKPAETVIVYPPKKEKKPDSNGCDSCGSLVVTFNTAGANIIHNLEITAENVMTDEDKRKLSQCKGLAIALLNPFQQLAVYQTWPNGAPPITAKQKYDAEEAQQDALNAYLAAGCNDFLSGDLPGTLGDASALPQ